MPVALEPRDEPGQFDMFFGAPPFNDTHNIHNIPVRHDQGHVETCVGSLSSQEVSFETCVDLLMFQDIIDVSLDMFRA